jgi:hypothetical protein
MNRKIRALFQFDEFVEVFSEFLGIDQNENGFEKRINETIFAPELYKEITEITLPVTLDCLKEESKDQDLVDKINAFGEKYRLSHIHLACTIDELGEM